jgi:hypothetical protein
MDKYIYAIMNIITKTEHPFHHLIHLLNHLKEENSSHESCKIIIGHYLQNENLFSENINDSFEIQDSHRIIKTNIFNLIYSLGNFLPKNLFETIFEKGIQISGFEEIYDLEKKTTIHQNILFKQLLASPQKQIFLWNQFLAHYGEKIFEQCLQENNTICLATSNSNFELLNFIFQKVSINFTNQNLETAIFFATKLSTLDYLNQFQPYWHQKNIYQEDCLSLIQKKPYSEKSFMANYVIEKMKQQPIQEFSTDSSYIQNRLHQNLIDMIHQKSTKKEFQQFIKKNNIENLSTIQDKNKIYLAHLLIQKEEVSKIELFSPFDIYHINDLDENVFSTLFFKNFFLNLTKITSFFQLMEQCLQYPSKNMNEQIMNHFLESGFVNQDTQVLPVWLFKKMKTNFNLAQKFLEVFSLDSHHFDLNPYFQYSDNFYDNNTKTYPLFLELFQKLVTQHSVSMIENPKKIQQYLFTYQEKNSFSRTPMFDTGTMEYLFNLQTFFQKYVPNFHSKNWISSVLEKFPEYLNHLQSENENFLKEQHNPQINYFELHYLKPLFDFIQKHQFFELYDFIPSHIVTSFLANPDNLNSYPQVNIYYQKKNLENELKTPGVYKSHKI